ncbi:unnamed protein product, partial [Ceratitis capitata]
CYLPKSKVIIILLCFHSPYISRSYYRCLPVCASINKICVGTYQEAFKWPAWRIRIGASVPLLLLVPTSAQPAFRQRLSVSDRKKSSQASSAATIVNHRSPTLTGVCWAQLVVVIKGD